MERTYRWAVEVTNVHVLQQIPCLIRVTDILERLGRVLPYRSDTGNMGQWDGGDEVYESRVEVTVSYSTQQPEQQNCESRTCFCDNNFITTGVL